MTPEEYAAQQLLISSAIARFVQQFGRLFARPGLSVKDWLGLLQLLFPEVQARRTESATLARTFYDSQRAQYHPELSRNDVFLEEFQFEEFVAEMEPVRIRVSQEDSPQHAIDALALRTMRSVENGGRRQIIHAVENDTGLDEFINGPAEPEPDVAPATRSKTDLPQELVDQLTPEAARLLGIDREPVKQPTRILGYDGQPVKQAMSELIRGWARVATGRETCAWCLMLISRGPVYRGADRAGLDLDETTALASYRDKSDLQTYFAEIEGSMEEWHTGCDCKVVPVFKRENWFGEAAAKRALELWNEATLEAISLEDDGLKHKSGKRKGRPFTRNELAINALRRRLNNGEISTSEFAALAA